MSPTHFKSFLFAAGALTSVIGAQTPTTTWEGDEFGALHRQFFAATKDAWEQVPWQLDLLAAQHVAASERKPLFVWAMDGHPLSCT